MEISLSLSITPRNQETLPKDGEHSRTSPDSLKIPSDIPSGKLHSFTINTDSELSMPCFCSTSTNQWCSTCSLSKRKKTWCQSGDGILEKTIGIMITLTLTDVCPLIVRRTTCDIRTSIKWEETRELAWSISIGGAETRISESTSKWERDMTSNQLFLVSITMISMLQLKDRTTNGPLWEHPNNQDEMKFAFLKKVAYLNSKVKKSWKNKFFFIN